MLDGKRILVVEDEPLIALDLEAAIRDWNGIVVGPAMTLADATRLAESEILDGAILDLRLKDDVITHVIHRLRERGVACVIHSGHANSVEAEAWPDIPIIGKPILPEVTLQALAKQFRAQLHRRGDLCGSSGRGDDSGFA